MDAPFEASSFDRVPPVSPRPLLRMSAAQTVSMPTWSTTPNHPGNQIAHLHLRIAALFIILVGSTLAALTPVFLARSVRASQASPARQRQWVQTLLDFTKYFGSGVILGTAFIHLLAPGVEALGPGNPALSEAWQRFPYALGLCLTSIVSIFVIEVAAMRVGARALSTAAPPVVDAENEKSLEKPLEGVDQAQQVHPIGARIISLAILEFGAIFHSVLIGLTLAVDPNFTVLCAVLVTHQIFEGLGIGSRLSSSTSNLPKRYAYLPFLGAVLFGISTPLGMAAGLAASSAGITGKDGFNGVEASVVSGVLDSLSAGILMYTALVELIGREILQNKELMHGPGRKLGAALLWVFMGCALMALLGKWV
ncbi:hypothetical protein MKEN_00445300 [Mycena kentingensis (nom. inval.)]|nr:hypothetical protein MKEN_00445300 [Mycena kentingensis (nom. inval.)]